MNIKDLKYLVAVADHKHFGKAADACFVSQPALSMQIMKLEESLGIALLERKHKSVRLTEHGGAIVARSRQILAQVNEVRDIAKSAKDPDSGELRLGLFPTLAPYLLPHIMPALVKAYPKLSFYLIEEKTQTLIDQLHQGQLHAALLASPVNETSFEHHALFEEEFLLAVPKHHPLANYPVIKPQHLNDVSLLLLDEGHCLRDQALSVCHRMKAVENTHFRATSLETLRHMVSAGVGITLMPKLACQSDDKLIYLPLHPQKPARTIALYTRNSSAKLVLLAKIANTIKLALAKHKGVTPL